MTRDPPSLPSGAPQSTPPLTDPPTAAKTSKPKPVLCWHFSPCLSGSYSVQSLIIWTVEHSHIRPDSCLANKGNLFGSVGIVTRAQPAAEMHCGYHVSLPPSTCISVPPLLFLYLFFVNVSWWPKVFLHTRLYLRINSLPDTSISLFPHLSTPDLFISAVGHYY